MSGWRWEPGGVQSALSVTLRRERRSETKRSSLTRQSTSLPNGCMHTFTWAAPVEMHKERLEEKKERLKDIYTRSHCFFPSLEILNKRWNKSFLPELTAQPIYSTLNQGLSQGPVPFKMAAHFCASLWCDKSKAKIQVIQVWKWNMSSHLKPPAFIRGFLWQLEQILDGASRGHAGLNKGLVTIVL